MTENTKSAAAIIVGTGIRKDGVLPDSCVANLTTAIDLYQKQQISKIIVSGKWAWNCKFTPPLTEASAMKKYLLSKQIPEEDIFVEDNSVTTVSNLCQIKKDILIPNNFRSVIFISACDILQERNEYNLRMILGPNYNYQIINSDFSYPPQLYQELVAKESQKIIDCKNFYVNITPGDHQTIYKLAMDDLNKNYINKKP